MEQMNEVKKMDLKELSKEELQNTFGGVWLEVRIIKGEIWFLYHHSD